jgi:hypothetical protein
MNRPSGRLEERSASAPSAPAGVGSAPALELDVLMARLRKEVQARKRQAAPEQAPSEAQRVRAVDMLELPEAAFVMTAYRALLGREADPDEADRQIDRLLLGRVRRTQMLTELLGTAEARAAGAVLEGLPQARLRERLMASPIASVVLGAANTFRTVYLLPKRIRQFVKRIEALEQRASEQARRIETLEQEALSLPAALAGATHSPVESKPAPSAASLSARRRSDAR